MAISTVGEVGSWTNPVQFGYDSKLNLYFVSMPNSRHMQNLMKDPRISVAIFKTERFPGTREVMGLQLRGTTQIAMDRELATEAAYHMYGRDPRKIDYTTKIEGRFGPNAEWQYVKIAPEEAWCFDSREFGEERRQIDLTSLSIKLAY